jgi:MFS family permease
VTGVLRRHAGLRRLWIGETTSTLGTRVDSVVLPLIAVTTLHSSAFVVSAIAAAVWLPWLLLGVVAGSIVDRRRRRSLMIGCDLVSALLFATIPLAGALRILTPAQLVVVAFGAGVTSVSSRRPIPCIWWSSCRTPETGPPPTASCREARRPPRSSAPASPACSCSSSAGWRPWLRRMRTLPTEGPAALPVADAAAAA